MSWAYLRRPLGCSIEGQGDGGIVEPGAGRILVSWLAAYHDDDARDVRHTLVARHMGQGWQLAYGGSRQCGGDPGRAQPYWPASSTLSRYFP